MKSKLLNLTAPLLVLSIASSVHSNVDAAETALPPGVEITIQRPGSKVLYVQLELVTRQGSTTVLGCQTGKRDKRCTRKRTRVPLSAAQLGELKDLWSGLTRRRQCLLRRLPEAWGKIWIRAGELSISGPLAPTRNHASLKDPCFHQARLGWWLLDRYDRRT